MAPACPYGRSPRLPRKAEAEDIAQSALEKCLLKWRLVERTDDTDADVHWILINTASDDETTRVDDADAIVRALQHLSDNQPETVVLRYYAHLTEEQMATTLAVAPGTIKTRLSRALKALADNPNLTELGEPR